jgi:dienelactone hydrolase
MKYLQMKMILGLAIIALTFAFSTTSPPTSFAQTAENREEGVGKSWEKAEVFVPGKFFNSVPSKVNVEKPLPVVIYIHGCTGISIHDSQWGSFIKGLGFIAVFPDSMARPGRKANCNPMTKRGGLFPQAHDMRLEEISYAFDQVKKSPWADTKNIFLMGHSEGGTAVALTRLDGFRGIIISSWTCTHAKDPRFDGIFAPLETPILTLEWDRDAWRVGKPQEGSCANKFGERKKAQRILFSGSQHDTAQQSEARDAVERFLKVNLSP